MSNSRDRKNLEEEWTKKLEKGKCEHDLELKHLKEEVRSGNQDRESRERKIKRGEEHLEERKEGRIVGKVKTVRKTTGRNEGELGRTG